MAREIKFRAWNTDYNWYENSFYVSAMDGVAYGDSSKTYDTPNIEINEEPNFIIEQFTGMKDSEGVEIYEGDICFLVDTEYEDEQYAVSYSDSQCKFYLKDHAGRNMGVMDDYELKVIGNIHQNPELL